MAKKKASITNYLETFTDEQKSSVGTAGQIRIDRYDSDDKNIEWKFVTTVEEAETVKSEWDELDK